MNYILPKKADLSQINIKELDKELPDLKNITETKAIAIARWFMEWIDEGLDGGKIRPGSLLPAKPEFAYLMGVSIGTIQNALRYIEDQGYVESKQCLGTLIKDKSASLRKLTSKREIAIEAIKKHIKNSGLNVKNQLPSSRNLAAQIGYSSNTTRLALEYLGSIGILQHTPSLQGKSPRIGRGNNNSGWMIKSLNFDNPVEVENETLVNKVKNELKDYIDQNLNIGDRIPAHAEFSAKLKVSIKTIHDALRTLISDGILLSKRGRYGTTVIKMPYDNTMEIKKETSIFAPACETAFYYYEKTRNHIKKMIAQDYEVGMKLPSILELSKELDLSPNTIRKAFHNLAAEGYIAFSRGRYGGTFVIDIPETDSQSFKWLAVNPKYAEAYKN
ncbi:MAG: GntR family transcriptional regulator [Heliobacteriaceae bacterium]|jgi:DNA-binding GntR family transcriptional regulator|nr:GntR family transcriptional regulator [Heliobacteriaceae bacterium]